MRIEMLTHDSPRKRVAQFTRHFLCQECGSPGIAASTKKKYCSDRCRTAPIERRRMAERLLLAQDTGVGKGAKVECIDCRAPITKVSWRHERCSPCAEKRASIRSTEWRRKHDGHQPLGTTMECQGCGTQIVRRGGLQKFCEVCRAESQRTIDRELYRASRNVPVAIIGDDLPCDGCGVFIERRGAGQKFCADCSQKSRNENARRTMAERRKNPKHRLNLNLSSAICRSIKVGSKGGRRWQEIVGFTLSDLLAHLEAQFLPGMTWSNHGDWHIDHIRPLCSFQFETPDDPQFREAWALTNLRPLWARDNLRKGGRLDFLL